MWCKTFLHGPRFVDQRSMIDMIYVYMCHILQLYIQNNTKSDYKAGKLNERFWACITWMQAATLYLPIPFTGSINGDWNLGNYE